MEENCHKRRRATAHQNMGELRRMTSLKCEKHNAIVILTLSSYQEDNMCSITKARASSQDGRPMGGQNICDM